MPYTVSRCLCLRVLTITALLLEQVSAMRDRGPGAKSRGDVHSFRKLFLGYAGR